MARGTPSFTLRLDPDIRRELERIAEKEGVTLAYVVRLALISFIERKKESEK